MSNGSLLRKFCFSLFLLAASIIHAQVPEGTLNGLVTDPKDADVVGAHVTAVSVTQGISRETISNKDGLYVLSNLSAGTYDLKIEQPGFTTTLFKAIEIAAGRNRTLDAKLLIASANAEVDVNLSGESLDITQSMIQGQITSKTIESIPLNGRNFL